MSNCPSVKLSGDSIQWACKHLAGYGDTDMLPVPLEYKAMLGNLPKVVGGLSDVDLAHHQFAVPRRVAIPKVAGGYRIASQLSPVDAVIYTALAYEVCECVERQRIPEARNQSCSYRAKPDATGRFFSEDEGYENYKSAIITAIDDPQVTHVVTLDLSDFYGQISHHRIQNNLEASGVRPELTKAIEHVLGVFNSNQHSQGLPIGPTGSIIFSEAAMIDIDDFISREGYRYTRYVDDFRLFFDSRRSAVEALRKLTEVLHSNHRLPINGGKTGIVDKENFTKEHFIDEEKLERDKKAKTLEDLKALCLGASKREIPLDQRDDNFAARKAIDELFARVAAEEPLPLGLARFVLRRARSLRTDKLLGRILANARKFLPVLRDVVLYFDAVDRNSKSGYYGSLVELLISDEETKTMPYVQEWCAYSLVKNDIYDSYEDYLSILNSFDFKIRIRYSPLIACKTGTWSAIRAMKDDLDGYDAATKRAILLASSVLSDDEKQHWLSPHVHSGDPIIAACAVFAKTNKSLNSLL